MTAEPAHGVPVLASPLVQPDRRSCGAAVLVVARMWQDAGFAADLLDRGGFAEEVLATHRRVTRRHDAAGRMQLPWPRALGTPPWAVARHLELLDRSSGRPTSWRADGAWPWSRRSVWDRLVTAVQAGRQVPVYVGSRWLPRHVVLVVAAGDGVVRAYDPAVGRPLDVRAEDFTRSRLRLRRWTTPWFVVLPG